MTTRRTTLLIGAALLAGTVVGTGAVTPASAVAPSTLATSLRPTLGLAPATSWTVADVALGDDPLAALAADGLHNWQVFAVTGLGEYLARFIAIRDAIAVQAASRIEVDPLRLQEAWAAADHRHQVVLMAAMTQLGTPYRKRTNEPGKGFDCSGFTSFAWSATDVLLPSQSRRQIRTVTPLTRDEAQPGDLVFYPGHISLYLGIDYAILHSPTYGGEVSFSHLRSSREDSVDFGGPIG
ncbi:MAG: C40 family peptidase [Ilumatobacteraceae bacterium]